MLKQHFLSGVAILTSFSLVSGTIPSVFGVESPASARIVSLQNDNLSHFNIAQSITSGVFERGTVLSLAEPKGRRIVLAPNDTANVTLVTTHSVRPHKGFGLIPKGTKVEGEFRPVGDGTQFVARRIIFRDGNSRHIDARSNIVSYRTTIQKRNTDPVWQGALVGGGASVLISSIVTKPGIGKTLAGAGAGALAGYLLGRGHKDSEVIVVRRNEPLKLILDSDLVLNSRY